LKPSPAGRLRRARQPPSLRTAPQPTRRPLTSRLVFRVHVHNTTTVFSQRSMRRLEASLRRATPKGHETFISRTAPHQGLAPTSGPPCVQDTPRHAQGGPSISAARPSVLPDVHLSLRVMLSVDVARGPSRKVHCE
jgi:hypothetical protein